MWQTQFRIWCSDCRDFFRKLYWLYGFLKNVRIFKKKIRIFSKKCTDCTVFFENFTDCTDFSENVRIFSKKFWPPCSCIGLAWLNSNFYPLSSNNLHIYKCFEVKYGFARRPTNINTSYKIFLISCLSLTPKSVH